MKYMIIDENGYGAEIFYGTYDEDEVDRLIELNNEDVDFYNIVKNKG